MKFTSKFVVALSAAALMAGMASAERYVMVTHGEGKDPFWPVVSFEAFKKHSSKVLHGIISAFGSIAIDAR